MQASAQLGDFCVILTLLVGILRLSSAFGTAAANDDEQKLGSKRNFIRKMTKDAWDSYSRYAWGEYAVDPQSHYRVYDGGVPRRSQRGTTILAALDTLYIMGLDGEFQLGKHWVQNLNFSTVHATVSIGESVEEMIAGLLSTYFLTNDWLFVRKAEELATKYLRNFDTPTGLPYRMLNFASEKIATHDDATYISELGTLHLEFLTLSNLTGKAIFKEKADGVRKFLREHEPFDGLYRDMIKVTDGNAGTELLSDQSHYLGALLNDWLQNGNQEARRIYDRALEALYTQQLVHQSTTLKLRYIAMKNDWIANIMSFNSCMAGGIFALGALSDPQRNNRSHDYLELAKELTNTCYQVSMKTQAKLPPARFSFSPYAEGAAAARYTMYKLEPHLAYSYFILYRVTRDEKYRAWGWKMVKSIQERAKIGPGGGYAIITDVTLTTPPTGHYQPPWFLGGTLKYLYLLFTDPAVYSLQDWVFNARGHLLPINKEGKNMLLTLGKTSQARVDSLRKSSVSAMIYFILVATACALLGAVGWKFLWPKVNAARATNYRGMGNNSAVDEVTLDADHENRGNNGIYGRI